MLESEKFDYEFLSKLGVYELRELARQVGVKSPTTKVRAELCDLILKIQNGEIEPNQKNLTKGRPPKSVSKVFSFADQNFELLNKLSPTASLHQANFNMMNLNDKVKVEGYLIYLNGKLCFYNKALSVNDTILITMPESYVIKYNLIQGDKIVGVADSSKANYDFVKLLSVNNVDVENFDTNRNFVDTNRAIKSNENIKFLNYSLTKGSRVIIEKQEENDAINELLNYENEDYEIVLIGGEIMPENYFILNSCYNLQNFTSNYGEDLRLIYNNIVSGYNHAESMLKEGKSVVVAILNPASMLRSLDMYFYSKNSVLFSDNHSPEAIQLFKKIVGCGRAISDDLYVNIVCLEIASEKGNEFVFSEIKNIVNKI